MAAGIDGPVSIADLVRAHTFVAVPKSDVPVAQSATGPASGDRPDWLIHETELLRHPVYRTERGDGEGTLSASAFDRPAPEQLPLLFYDYDDETHLLTRLGELNARDMLVMSVIQHEFYSRSCPVDARIDGDHATLSYIARQLGMHPEGSTNLIRASLERLATAKVRLRFSKARESGNYPINSHGEVVFGFLSGYGWRERSMKGRAVDRTNWIALDPTLAALIRKGNFTFLRADVLRRLRTKPLALKLYAWARTHRPTERGTLLPHSVNLLAHRLGCSDTNVSRRRKKVERALSDVCAAAPGEFPRYEIKRGRTDFIVTLYRKAPAPVIA